MNTETQFLGELSPLLSRRHGKLPERRQVSKRWLVSSVLVGMTSLFLMGGALFAALEGREQLTLPAQAYERLDNEGSSPGKAIKGNNPGLFAKVQQETSNVMMVSTVSRVGNKNVVKLRPFLSLKANMAAAPRPATTYPAFNPLAVFSESGNTQTIAKSNNLIYGADVESEVTLNVIDFPFDAAPGNLKQRQRSSEIEDQVRAAAANIDSGNAYITALAYFDAERFSQDDKPFIASGNVTITAENVSVLEKYPQDQYPGIHYDERIIKVTNDYSVSEVFLSEGVGVIEANEVQTVLASDLGTSLLQAGDRIRAIFRMESADKQPSRNMLSRVSIYRGSSHLVSVARNDNGRFVYAILPDNPEDILNEAGRRPVQAASSLPTAYDAIYRSALSEGLTESLAGSLVRIFAFDVDFRSRISQNDKLEAFVSLEEGKDKTSEESEILYAAITLGNLKRRYYRFRDTETDIVDYYDETGKSAKKFLLRKPVPNGRFRSKFGMRKHPISRVYKLHGGVDWSAPRGTPIIAAGNGVIEKAGWAGGSGKRTIIRHANGYETYYLHQTAFAKGIKPGIRVRQGQVIGYVGSTGYSTGPHLHYEVHVNGNRVNPMSIRLPKGKVLKDAELAAFEAERDRINALLYQDDLESTEVASN